MSDVRILTANALKRLVGEDCDCPVQIITAEVLDELIDGQNAPCDCDDEDPGPGIAYATKKEIQNLRIDVKADFDAIGDGIADDTLKIQAALNQAAAKGPGSAGGISSRVFFPPGLYRLSRQGQFINKWQNAAYLKNGTPAPQYRHYALYLQGKSNVLIDVHPDARFVMDMNDAVKANFLVLQDCSDMEIKGWDCIGQGIQTRQLYNAAGLHIDSCIRIYVEQPKAIDTHHNTVGFLSRDLHITKAWTQRSAVPFVWGGIDLNFPVPDPLLLTHMGTHVGLYACQDSTVRDCVSYGGCDDGDVGILGGGSWNCRFENNHLYNYFFEDAVDPLGMGIADDVRKKCVKTAGQGLFIDSGPVGTVAHGNYVEGYYYGIDVKTDTESSIVTDNRATGCMVGITTRRGEANLPQASTKISNNHINPNGGNGREIYAGSIVGFDPDKRGYVRTPVGIWLQDCRGAEVSGNEIGNNYYTVGVINNFVGVYLSNTRGFNDDGPGYSVNTLISNNTFLFEQRQGALEYGYNEREAVIIAGNPAVAEIPDPSAPAVSQAATAGATLPAGTYYCAYSWRNEAGETRTSPETSINMVLGNRIVVSIPGLPAGATAARIYIGTTSGILYRQGDVTATFYSRSTPLTLVTPLPSTPLSAPTLSQSAAVSTLEPGTYYVSFSWRSEAGETMRSPEASINIASGNMMTVTFPTFPPGADAARVYMGFQSGVLYLQNDAAFQFTDKTSAILTEDPAPTANATLDKVQPVLNVSLINNTIDSKYTHTGDEYPNGLIRCEYVQQLTITNTMFQEASGNFTMLFKECVHILMTNNSWRYHWGLAQFEKCLDVDFSHNQFQEGILGSTRPYLRFIDTQVVKLHSNSIVRRNIGVSDGYFFTLEGACDYFSVKDNILNLGRFNPALPQSPSPFYTGTLDLTGTFPKNVIDGNIFIPRTVSWLL